MYRIKILFMIIFCAALFSESLLAIPAFARKYRMSCQTCHSPIPRLKPYGNDFAGNGFVLSDQDAPRYYVETGDDELSLIRELPLAIRLDGYVTYRHNKMDQGDFGTPYILKLLSGGSIADNLAYYFYFLISERGELVGVEDAYLMFNNLFGTELDVYLGQFQVSDPLFKRELRLTLEDYQIYKTKVGASNISVAYDRGIMLTYGFDTGTDIIVEVVNGNGLAKANDLKTFDNDEYKNFAGRISQDVTQFLRVGAFGYYGKEKLSLNVNNTPTNFINKVWMAGGDASLNFSDIVEVNFQYLQRNDDKPLPNLAKSVETKGIMTELVFTPDKDNSKWYGVAMYNWVDSEINAHDFQSVSGHLGYLLRRNLRLVAEYTYNLEDEYGLFALGFVSAF